MIKKIGEFATVKGGKRMPKGSSFSDSKNNHPYIRIRDLGQRKILDIDEGYVFVPDDIQKTISRYVVSPRDIVVSIVGTIGLVGIIGESLNKANLTENCVKITVFDSLVDVDYLYYYLVSFAGQHEIAKRTVGAVQPKLPLGNVLDIPVPIPRLKVQKAISKLLSSLDEKIEINSRINGCLFTSLFAKYLEEIDLESDKGLPLKDLCTFQEGYVNPPQDEPSFFDGNIKWLRAVDINESFIIQTSRTLSDKGFQSAKKSAFLYPPYSIAISKSGTIGRLGIIGDCMCGNRAVIGIIPKDRRFLPLVYSFLKTNQREIELLAVGSVQKNLYVSQLEQLTIPAMKRENLDSFLSYGSSVLSQIENNCREIDELSQIRDTLLPKFMSGEIDVDSAEIG